MQVAFGWPLRLAALAVFAFGILHTYVLQHALSVIAVHWALHWAVCRTPSAATSGPAAARVDGQKSD